MEFEPVIGLEVHAQLDTQTKLFCSCPLEFGAEPNTNVCPVCLGLPGSLPVLNKNALRLAIIAALSLNCRINTVSIFARKNYFYPDLPKGYQISQYERPLAEEGYLKLQEGTVRIRRLHLEEDAGKNIHFGEETLVDLNRAGAPLVEIVTEPDISSPEMAREFLENLRDLLRYAGASKADMEKGQLRCDINISIRPKGTKKLGTRVEVKNVNSFRFVQKAIEFEIQRQLQVIKSGQELIQETRLFDPESGMTFSMREKEESHDYRYFPEPDLLPVVLKPEFIKELERSMPELPSQRLKKLTVELGLEEKLAQILTQNKDLGDYFFKCLEIFNEPKTVANWVINDLLGALNEASISLSDSPVSPGALAELLKSLQEGKLSVRLAKQALKLSIQDREEPMQVVQKLGLSQLNNEEELKTMIEEVIKEHPHEVLRYKNGEEKLFGFLVGQIMKKTKGKANPQTVNKLLKEILN
ncbi:MAG: Asp-tRNA(Asn)/Glu-tRNA(Gln) amidotransferase subunit GatB [Aquificaceae bacterium]